MSVVLIGMTVDTLSTDVNTLVFPNDIAFLNLYLSELDDTELPPLRKSMKRDEYDIASRIS
jgi:hypothetical protein